MQNETKENHTFHMIFLWFHGTFGLVSCKIKAAPQIPQTPGPDLSRIFPEICQFSKETMLQWGSNRAKQNYVIFLFFLLFLRMSCWGFIGFMLSQNCELRSPDLLQYFLDDFGNFENFVKIWTRGPPNYYEYASKNARRIRNHPGNILCLSIWD